MTDSTYQNASPQTEQRRLTSTASSWSQVAIIWIQSPSPNVVVSLEMHDCLRLIGPREEYAAFVPQDIIEMRSGGLLAIDPGNIRCIGRLASHAMILFGGNRKTEEGALGLRE